MKKHRYILSAFLICLLVSAFCATSAHSYGWGDDWKFNKCSKCSKWYKHVGKDLSAKKGQTVTFTEDCYFVAKGYDGTWKGWIVVRDSKNSWTYVVWHLSDIPSFKSGQSVKGKKIGKVADMGGNTHVHIGFRGASYSSLLSMKGALPNCDHKPGGLPKFPEKFATPYMKIKIQ